MLAVLLITMERPLYQSYELLIPKSSKKQKKQGAGGRERWGGGARES